MIQQLFSWNLSLVEADFLFDNQKMRRYYLVFPIKVIPLLAEINAWTWNFGDGTVLGLSAASTPINTANTSGTANQPIFMPMVAPIRLRLLVRNSIGLYGRFIEYHWFYSELTHLFKYKMLA